MNSVCLLTSTKQMPKASNSLDTCLSIFITWR